jgi:hypothetical protein
MVVAAITESVPRFTATVADQAPKRFERCHGFGIARQFTEWSAGSPRKRRRVVADDLFVLFRTLRVLERLTTGLCGCRRRAYSMTTFGLPGRYLGQKRQPVRANVARPARGRSLARS